VSRISRHFKLHASFWCVTRRFRSIDDQSKEAEFFEVSVFMKKKFAFRHHLVGSTRISSADFLSCLEPKELPFALQKDGRESNRGDIVATLQFEVTHRNLSAVDELRPGHYRRIALQLINRVVLSTLRELPKGAEYVLPACCF
jgi:hypothetical protein